jgi:integrase
MATIRKRKTKSGVRYQASVRVGGERPAHRTFTRKRDAERWAAAQEVAIEAGEARAPSASLKPLRDVLRRYGDQVTALKKGWRQELSRLRVIAKAPFAAKAIGKVTPQEVAEWRDARLAACSASTVRNDLVVLSSVFEHARKEWRLVLGNPARDVRWPAMPRGRDRRLREGEEAALLANADPVERALIIVLLETGMRLGEALSVTYPGSLDLGARTVTLEDTKNKQRRVVPLTRRAALALKSVPVNLHTGRLFPWNASLWGHRFDKIRRRAGVPDLRTHDLRHEAVSRLFERGFNPMEVAAISGHKTLAMLARYTHLRAEDLVKRLDETGQK